MNVLISGGAGFIGTNISLALVKKGYQVTVLDNLSTQIHGLNPKSTSPLFKSIKSKVKFIEGDVSQKSIWFQALKNQDMVIHLAAETGTGQSMYEIERYSQVNISGTSLMLDIIANGNFAIQKVVIASSRSIYGEGKYECENHGIVYPQERNPIDMINKDFTVKCPKCLEKVKLLPTDEESLTHPSSIYGLTKQVQEQMCLITGKSINMPVVSLRYQNVYGPGQSLTNPYTGILSIFSTRILNCEDINIFEDGNESRDFVYIDDVVNATILSLEMEEANYNVYNVGSGKRTSVLEVAETLNELYGFTSKIHITGNFRIGDIRDNFADLTKIKNDLNFQPKTFFKEGIKNFVDWVKTQDIQKDKYEESLIEMKRKGFLK